VKESHTGIFLKRILGNKKYYERWK
jgi:hypothetical protein